MIPASQAAEELRSLAWNGLGAVAAYFCLASLALRWRPRKGVRVAQYEPPAGVSPALAAYLRERGLTDKPLVVAMLNMSAKGYLRIEQGPADYLLSRADASAPLEAEEEVVAETLFRGTPPAVRLSTLFNLERIAQDVRACLESTAEPDLISSHFAWFIPGLTLSLWCFLAALYPEMEGLWNSDGGRLVIIPALVAVWALVAVSKTLPATLYKVKSYLPGRTPRPLRFVKGDRTAPLLLLLALAALGAVAWLTSLQFALLFGWFLVVNLGGLMALRSPTTAGNELLDRLSDFRLFFAAVDSDRMNRVNAPNAPSAVAEKYWGWALALDVEHAWGEQFAAAVLNRLGPGSAMASIEAALPEPSRAASEILDLHLQPTQQTLSKK